MLCSAEAQDVRNRLRPKGNYSGSQSNQTNNPSKNEVGLDVSHHTRIFSRGGENSFLDILFHGMSAMAWFRQQSRRSGLKLPCQLFTARK
jgi:hypothetical protein